MKKTKGLRSKFFISTLMAGLFFCLALTAEASHFRYGHLTWKPKTSVSPTTVEFTLVNAFRRTGYPGTAGDGFPAVGDIITENIGGTNLRFGDGGITSILRYKVIAIDITNNSLLAQALEPGSSVKTTIDHTYPAANNAGQPWLAEINSTARTGSEINNPNKCYRVSTKVETASGNRSPVSGLPAIVNMAQSAASSFLIPAADSDPNTIIRWRLATPGEPVGPGCALFNQPTAGGNNLTINNSTGQVSWNTSSAIIGGLYSCQVIIEDLDATTLALKTQVAVDFLIKVVSCPSNNPPVFASPSPACGSTLTAAVGVPFSFVVNVSDAEPGNVILNTGGLPSGAVMLPGLPSSGNPVSSIFSWTPTASDAGSHVVIYSATDACGAQTLCSYTINVSCPPATIFPGGSTTFCSGDSVTLTASAGVSYLWSTGDTTASITVFTSGIYSVAVTSPGGCVGNALIPVTVNPSPIANAGADATVYYGYAPAACTTLNGSAGGGTSPYSFLWSNAATSDSTTVCPALTTSYSLAVTDSNGCKSQDTVVVSVIDARCGNNMNKVRVCHIPSGNPSNPQTLCIAASAIPAHMSLHGGDYLGSCVAARLGSLIASEQDQTIILNAAPNPFSGTANIEFNLTESDYVTLNLYDVRGVLVQRLHEGKADSGKLYSFEINGSELSGGIYFARLVTNNGVQHLKLIKNNQ